MFILFLGSFVFNFIINRGAHILQSACKGQGTAFRGPFLLPPCWGMDSFDKQVSTVLSTPNKLAWKLLD